MIRLRLPFGSQGAQICLCDRWFNPVDPVISSFAQYVMVIDRGGNLNQLLRVPHDVWLMLEIRWADSRSAAAEFRLHDSTSWYPLPLVTPSDNGLNYLHVQSTAESNDPHGILLGEVTASVAGSGV